MSKYFILELNVIIWTVVYTAISSAVALLAVITVIIVRREQTEKINQTSNVLMTFT